MMQERLTLLPLFLALLLNLQPTSSEPCTSSFSSALLSRTNYHRKFHHSPSLALNASLTARAQGWADQLLASGSQAARHRPNRRLSENLFLKITDSGVHLSASLVVDSWYAGSQLYGQYYGSEPNLADFSSWRYFTAMIWAASRQVGIGCSTEILLDGQNSGKRITYVVANFSPRGNVVGGFKENVRRPKRKVEVYQTTSTSSSYNRTSTTKTSTAKTPSYSSTTTKATTSRKPYKKPASTRPTSTTTTTTAKPSSPTTTTTTTTKKYPSTATTKLTTARTTRKAPSSYSTTKYTKTTKPTTAKPATTKVYPRKTTRKTSTSATKYTSATKRTTTTTKAPASTSTAPVPTFYQPSYSNQNIPYSNPNFYHHHRPQYYRPRPRPPPPPPSSSIFSHEDLLDLHEAANLKWPPSSQSRPKPVFYLPPNYQNSKPSPARPSSFPFKPLPLSSFLSPNLPNFHHYPPPSPHQKHVFRPSFYRPVYKPVKFYKHTQNNPVVNDNNNSVRRSVNTNSKPKQ